MRTTLALALALVAAAIAPATAAATSVVVRANATPVTDNAWTSTPSGAAHTVLADPVLQPTAPSTASDYISAGNSSGDYVGMTFPAPSLPAGTAPTAVTAWVYNQVGASQYLTVSLWTGQSLLGYTTFPSGQALGWHSFTLSPTPTAAQLSQLGIALRADGNAGGSPSKVYAAYVQVDVPDAPSGGSDPAGTPASDPSVPAKPKSGDDGLPGVPATGLGKTLKSDSPLAPAAAPVVIAAPATVELPAQAKAVPVTLGCPDDAVGSCKGRAVLELVGAAPSKRAQARAARCARGCRVIGDSSFNIAAGVRKPIRIAMRPTAAKLLPRGRSVKVRLTVTSRDAAHGTSTTSRIISIRRGRAA